MREILFKAKRTDNGEWVEGWYCEYPFSRWPLKPCIIPSVEAKDGEHKHIEVDHETVCQYTGLTDKNGVKIWEGDKLRGWWFYGREIDSYVSFRAGAFGIVWMRGKIEEFSAFTSICNVEFEVVGNIHDKEN